MQKTRLLRHFYTKLTILPRQARDIHRGNSKQRRFSLGQFTIKVCPTDRPPLILGTCSSDETDCDLLGQGVDECIKWRDPCSGRYGNGIHNKETIRRYGLPATAKDDSVTAEQCLQAARPSNDSECGVAVGAPFFMCGTHCGACLPAADTTSWVLTLLIPALVVLCICMVCLGYVYRLRSRKPEPDADPLDESQPLQNDKVESGSG